jgi:long-chain acyl-CoA synthetase
VDALHRLTLGDILREHGRSRPGATAVVCRDVRLTWPEFDARVDRLAAAMRDVAGVAAGDRVLWLAQNCHRFLETVLAAGRLGAMVCPANWRSSPEELAFVIDDVDARLVIWQDEEIGDVVRAARAASGSADRARWFRHDADGDESYEGLLAAADEHAPVDVDPGTPVLLVYTAAFEGRPNGALLSHRAVAAQDLVIADVQRITADYVFLNSGPLFHLGTLMWTFATFHLGGTNVFVRRVDPEELCRLIDAERCTGAFLLPPTRERLREINHDNRYDLSSLHDESPWARSPGGWGQTEAMGMATFTCIGGPAVGPHGRPSPFIQLRVVDPDDHEVAVGEIGELTVRGPVVMNGYHRRPELNAARQRGGWHHTNDLGRREADGSLTFIGPKSRMLKSAAENIYPVEIERCIAEHAAVREVAVIGVPDPVWTQSVKAIVVVEDGAAVNADDIVEHCRARIASYKKPRTVEFVAALPRLASGAVDYDELDRRFGGGGYPGGWNRSA